MKSYVAPVTAGSPHTQFTSFDNALSEVNARDARLLGGFAYATLDGVQHFIAHAKANKNWDPISKRFVIGVHHGITEPSALERLRSIRESEVRIFVPGKRLNADALVSTPLFHPKVFAITTSNNTRLRFLQAGSANMTSSALSDHPKNYEISISIDADKAISLAPVKVFVNWWSRVWKQSWEVDTALIKRYADLRLRMLERNPILRHAAGPSSNIRSTEYFFIEVGAASGPPGLRHQIEFPESLAAFFGRPVPHRRDLTLSSHGVVWHGRPLSFKTTTYGVEIWRLGMPTQHSGGEPVANRVIRFRRLDEGRVCDFEVADTNSNTVLKWTKSANIFGHIGATHGQRQRLYGFY